MMLSRLGNFIIRARRDSGVRNVFYLSLGQAALLITPLVTFPWVLRSLGPGAYGSYAFALAISQYLLIVVDFGFQFSGAKAVAELRDDKDALSEYFWTVQFAKLGLLLLALTLAVAVIFWVPAVGRVATIFVASLPILFGSLLQPVWFFMGVERLGVVSVLNVGARLLTIPAIFLLVHDPSDSWTLAMVNSSAVVAAGVGASFIIYWHRLIGKVRFPSWSRLRASYNEAWHLFVATSAVSLYAASNGIVLGLVNTKAELGYFSASDRIRSLALMPILPITNAYYAQVSRLFMNDSVAAWRLLRKLLIIVGSIMFLVSLAMFSFAPLIVNLIMGHSFKPAIDVVRILSTVPVLVGINSILGNFAMINLGFKRQFSAILLRCGAVNILLLIVLGHKFGARGAAASLCITEIIVTFSFAYFLHKRKGHRLSI